MYRTDDPSDGGSAVPGRDAPAVPSRDAPAPTGTAPAAEPPDTPPGPGTADAQPRGGLAAYRRLFAPRGTVAFVVAGAAARLPAGMLTVAAVLLITAYHGSYALAGAVTATGLAATALVGPLTARLVDRYGQARVAVPAVLLAGAAELALVVCVVTGAPLWTLFVASAATSPAPNTGGMSRARWAHLYSGDDRARHSANSLEQAVDELCYTSGPVLAAVLATVLFPAAGHLVAVALLVGGTVAFALQRRTEPPVAPRDERGAATSPLRLTGLKPLLVTFLCTGAVFGSLEVVTIAFADEQGSRGWAGAVLAMQALGSGIAGLVFGMLRTRGAPHRRFGWCTLAMAGLMSLPLLAAGTGSLVVLAPVLLVAGMATAPTMVTGMTLVQRVTPASRLNEGMTLAVTALLGGISLGAAGGGWAVEHIGGGAGTGFLVPAGAAAAAALLAVTVTARQLAPGRSAAGTTGGRRAASGGRRSRRRGGPKAGR